MYVILFIFKPFFFITWYFPDNSEVKGFKLHWCAFILPVRISLALSFTPGMSMDDVRAYEKEQQEKTNNRVTEGINLDQANVS